MKRIIKIPGESFPSSGWQKILMDLFGVIIIVIIANVIVGKYISPNTTNLGYWTIRQKWSLLDSLKSPVDTLILGDSSCNQGVVPSVLEQELGGKALNLCTTGNMLLVDDYLMLDRYIKKFGPPTNVVLVHVYDIWSRQGSLSELGNFLPLSFLPEFSPPLELTVGDYWDFFLARYVPLVSENTTIRNILLDGVRITPSYIPESTITNDGFMPFYEPNPDKVESDYANHLENLIKIEDTTGFEISDLNQAALEKIRELAEQEDFQVYLINSPLYEDLNLEIVFQEYLLQEQSIIQDLIGDSEHVVYIKSIFTFPKNQMLNVDHVIYQAAEAYTHKLASVISKLRK